MRIISAPRRLRILAAVLLALAGNPTVVAAQTALPDAMGAARAARARGDFPAAEVAVRAALAERPNDVEALTLLAALQAFQNHYPEALASIDRAASLAPADMDVVLTRARILAWMSRYDEARRDIDTVLAANPHNAEALALQGRLAMYQSRPSEAEKAFAAASAADPNNLDAIVGMGDALRAQGDEVRARAYYLRAQTLEPTSKDVADRLAVREDTQPRWRLDVSGTHSWLSRTLLDDWSEQAIRLERRLSRTATVYGGVFHAHRFGLSDVQLTLGGTAALASALTADLMVGVTPNDEFLPAWTVRPALSLRLGDQTFALLETNFRHYSTGTIKSVNVGAEQYLWDGRLYLMAKFINSIDSGGKHLTGWTAVISINPIDRLQIRAGYADAPESEAGVVADTRSWSVGIAYDLTAMTTLRLDFQKEDRQRAYVRRDLTAGLSFKF